MKKIWIIGLVVVGVVVLAGIGTVGVALANGNQVGNGHQPMMQTGDEEGTLHDYMIAAFAEAVDLTPEVLEARLEDGEGMYEIAEAQGIPADQIPDVLKAARNKAVEAALADGVISQEQADWMKSHGVGQGGRGLGRGGRGRGACDGNGMQFGGGMRRGGRW